jgi:D-alanyl-D-alanine carboxypeptidase
MEMRTSRRAALAGMAAALALSAGAPAPAAAHPAGDPYRAMLQGAIDDLRDLGASGAQGQISAGRRVTVARSGVADRRTGAPMPAAGYFRIGSTTKTFVAVAALQLVAEGRLSLDDPVERWLPGVVAGNGNDGTRITVRNLLQHTSGIYNYTQDLPVVASAEGYREHRFDHYEPAELVAVAMRHPPGFAPGEHWSYSNTNFVLAGMVIERAGGRPWAERVRSGILRPLGLRDTFYPGDLATLPRPAAHAYQQFAPAGPYVDTSAFNATVADAAGGMVSTTADLARFWRALERGELLPPAQMAQMRATVPAEEFDDVRVGVRYGLGILHVPNRCGGFWAHPGDVPGTSTFNGVAPGGERVVVLYRASSPATGGALDERALRLVDDALCGA